MLARKKISFFRKGCKTIKINMLAKGIIIPLFNILKNNKIFLLTIRFFHVYSTRIQ